MSAVVYPIILDMRAKRAVVVGGGSVAERKIAGLLEAGADVVCVAPSSVAGIERSAADGRLRLERRAYATGDLAGATLAFTATGDPETDARVVADAHALGVLVNDASDAERGDFATPAAVRAGPLLITVDSGGRSPAFAKRIRDELAERFDARYARATETLGRMREYVHATLAADRRAEVLRRLARLDVDALAAMHASSAQHAVDELAASFEAAATATPAPLVCASRGSRLALTQARAVAARLAEAGIPSMIETIATTADRHAERAFAELGAENVFVTELEVALRERRADYAVHSCKDLPSALPDDMRLAAITVREDPRDAFCSERYPSFEALPSGARVGTSSPRRRAQLAALRPDLVYAEIRGNVDTRLRKLAEGQYDALVLAMAGLRRLGAAARHTVPFPPEALTPAAGQGALGIETRAQDPLGERLHRLLADEPTELAVLGERAFLRTIHGGCAAPVGAHGTYAGGRLRLRAVVASPDGARVVRADRSAPVREPAEAEALGAAVAGILLAEGAAALFAAPPLAGRLFLLPRTQDRPSRIAAALRDAGAEVVEARDGATARRGLGERVPDAILFPSSGSVLAVAEYLTTLPRNGGRPGVVAMGPASAAAAATHGWSPDVVAPDAEIPSFVQAVTRYALEHAEEDR